MSRYWKVESVTSTLTVINNEEISVYQISRVFLPCFSYLQQSWTVDVSSFQKRYQTLLDIVSSLNSVVPKITIGGHRFDDVTEVLSERGTPPDEGTVFTFRRSVLSVFHCRIIAV
jgi:hypothetical protein